MYSLDDMEITYVVHVWLQVVAKDVDFDECVTTAVEALSICLSMASYGYSKRGATHLDTNKFV